MSDAPADGGIRGSLRRDDTAGTVRLEALLPAGIDTVWAALSERDRLVEWLGEIDGDFRLGAELHSRFFATGWEGTIHVEACHRPDRLLLLTRSNGEPDCVMDVMLTADGEQTALIFEDRGLPLDQIAAYGAGDQVLVEDLASYLVGRGRCEARARWQELHPYYQRVAAERGGAE